MNVRAWCVERLGVPVCTVLFESGLQSRVTGVRLADGREVVVKVRPWRDRLTACASIQNRLAGAGYCCPRVLDGPAAVAGRAWSIEEHRGGGEPHPPGPDVAGLSARLLAQLIALTSVVDALDALRGVSPPWVGWDHHGRYLWCEPDTFRVRLNDHPGPRWLDETAGRARAALLDARLPPVVGHGDWGWHNLRWVGTVPRAVHDWDSLIAQPEPAVVGAAAATWAADQLNRHAATLEESQAFIDAYLKHSGRPWDRVSHHLAWAAGLWTLAYNAKKNAVTGGGPQLDLLSQEVTARRRNANL